MQNSPIFRQFYYCIATSNTLDLDAKRCIFLAKKLSSMSASGIQRHGIVVLWQFKYEKLPLFCYTAIWERMDMALYILFHKILKYIKALRGPAFGCNPPCWYLQCHLGTLVQ